MIFFFGGFKPAEKKSDPPYISIEELVKEHKLSLAVVGEGGHQGDCLQFELKNLTQDTLRVLIEQGRHFVSEDSSLQDILLIKNYEFLFPPLAKLVKVGYGFCCEASMRSPYAKALFNVGFMSPKEWKPVLEILSNNSFDPSTVQSAVWVLSDNHAISSVHDDKNEHIQSLREALAKVKKLELPWYNISYEQDTAMLFTGRYKRLWGSIDYQLKHNSFVYINIRSIDGIFVMNLVEDMPQPPGEYTYKWDISVKNWPKGEYDVNIYIDGANLLLKKRFKL
jgi:hypothetical protein